MALAGLGSNPGLEGSFSARLDWRACYEIKFSDRQSVSSLNCDRPLHSGLKAPKLVIDAGCRDNRWTASLCTSPPGCSPGSRASTKPGGRQRLSVAQLGWYLGAQVQACSRETHSPSRASKTYGHNAFQIIHIHTTVIKSGRAHTTQHRIHCGAALGSLADAAVIPPSPK